MTSDPLDRFVDELARTTPEEARAMRACWDAADPGPRSAVWKAAEQELRKRHAQGQIDEAREILRRWVGDQPIISGTVLALSDPDKRLEVRIAAMPPLLDAALAYVSAAFLEPESLDVLMAPLLGVHPEATVVGADDADGPDRA